jgi:hypothetical protein
MVLMVLWDHMVLTECLMDLMECLTVLTMNMFLTVPIMNMFLTALTMNTFLMVPIMNICLMDLTDLWDHIMNICLTDHIMNMFLMDHTVQCLTVLTGLTDSWDPISALLTTTVLIWNQNTCDTTAPEVK